MMVNIFKNQQNILFVCPSHSWGSRERTVLRDCSISKNIGHNVFLYCLRDSFLATKAKEQGVDLVFHKGQISSRFFKWKRPRELQTFIKRMDITLVHCYKLLFFWPLSLILKNNKKIPLIMTFNKNFKGQNLGYFHQRLLKRLDLAFSPSLEVIGTIHEFLGLPIRKIKQIGFGINADHLPIEKSSFESTSSGAWFIGVSIDGQSSNIDKIIPIIMAVGSLNMKEVEKRVKVLLLSEKKWTESVIYSDLVSKVNELGFASDILFESISSCQNTFKKLDIWIGKDVDEALEDFSLEALLNTVPLIAPRTSSSMELFRKYGKCGESYKAGDARELRSKIELVIKNYSKYREVAARKSNALKDEFGETYYKNQFFTYYERSINKRLRLTGVQARRPH